jgi:hypothetical protein
MTITNQEQVQELKALLRQWQKNKKTGSLMSLAANMVASLNIQPAPTSPQPGSPTASQATSPTGDNATSWQQDRNTFLNMINQMPDQPKKQDIINKLNQARDQETYQQAVKEVDLMLATAQVQALQDQGLAESKTVKRLLWNK